MGRLEPVITWRSVTPADFGLLSEWLAQPHVARWWNHETGPDAVERDFGPTARGEEPAEDLLALVDGVPVGLVQRSRLADYPDYLAELAEIVEVPDGAVTIDYLVGDPGRVGQGLGTTLIAAMVERTWRDHPTAPAVVVPVVAANRASWRALEKAGGYRVGTGPMEPDNPVDDPEHHVYRFDRPEGDLGLTPEARQPACSPATSPRGARSGPRRPGRDPARRRGGPRIVTTVVGRLIV